MKTTATAALFSPHETKRQEPAAAELVELTKDEMVGIVGGNGGRGGLFFGHGGDGGAGAASIGGNDGWLFGDAVVSDLVDDDPTKSR